MFHTKEKRNKHVLVIEEYRSKRGLSPIWFILRKMAKRYFVYHCWRWLAVTLKWLLHMLWISHHYATFTECRNENSVAEIDTNSIFMIWWLNPLLELYSSIIEKAQSFPDGVNMQLFTHFGYWCLVLKKIILKLQNSL